ncbi:alpha/beta hydrolase [Georgenia sp. EYE_87]|uniref:alpha/beta fold hydrolase n=1 Tax=Georgenia sp. EYE_87 TaxID=2853448 RepID=UPI002006C18F|nr:alpha/beta hydrolase [Georgenia sp. EYE_87]MCK6211639.1 alpha/beta hydrolase [Georgenia sp. EYE_87]
MDVLHHRAAASRHTPATEEVYRRMLDAAGVDGRFVARPSGRLVHVVAAGDGPPVVHLHGTNTSSLSHLMLVGRMPALRSYLVDRPGCGLSDADPFRPGRFREYGVGFVGDVMDALDLDAAVLVGASGGGIWATWYALAHPERVRGMVMLGSVPTLPGGRPPRTMRLAATPGIGDLMVRAVRPGRRTMLQIMTSMGEAETIGRHPDLFDSLVAGARDPVATRANLAELRALISPRGILPSMRFTREDLRRLAVPTLMIWGDRDPVVPLARARAAATEIPDARLEVLPAGHVPQLGNPDRVAALLEEFAMTAWE